MNRKANVIHSEYYKGETLNPECNATRNNGAKLIVKHFNTSVAQHFYPIKIRTTRNALPKEVVTRSTVNSFKNSLDKHSAENPQMSELTGSNPCTIPVCTNSRSLVGERSAGNGPNGLSYDYYYYYKNVNIIIIVFSLIALPNQIKVHPKEAKKASSIHYGYRIRGTHARVFSQTLVHGNSKNEIR